MVLPIDFNKTKHWEPEWGLGRVIPSQSEPLCGEREERDPGNADSFECRLKAFSRVFVR